MEQQPEPNISRQLAYYNRNREQIREKVRAAAAQRPKMKLGRKPGGKDKLTELIQRMPEAMRLEFFELGESMLEDAEYVL
jgi:hypothetical protein